ncbi:MAG: lysophospholipid acyltransferase family protein [Brevinema sp.]
MKKIHQIWYFFYYYCIYFWLTILLIAPLCIVMLILRLNKIMSASLFYWSWGFFVPVGQKLIINGGEKIPKDKPCVIVSNHSSMIDVPMLGTLMKRPYAWVLKESLLKVPVVGWLLSLGLGIPIPRSRARASQDKIMNTISKIKNRNSPSILIFPEGTRSRSGKVMEFKRGFIKILKSYPMDVVPVTLIGSHGYIPTGSLLPYPQKQLEVKVHDPIPWQKLVDMDEKEAAELVRGIVESSLPLEP